MYEIRTSVWLEEGRIRVVEVAPYMLSIKHSSERKQRMSLQEVKGIFVKFYRGDKE